ncbi:hypothetical protein BC937DRAFT_89672 [Endogone sp. FLAS-F59071]|nr:hypothetical protein BC937DRAFT_89672 [Endogone sp. FLAS-F59071]|eukprot:RUS17655.1 hypothetical protein BC937DRAFT_89672 [Endogone sp. FLAS-F59071]
MININTKIGNTLSAPIFLSSPNVRSPLLKSHPVTTPSRRSKSHVRGCNGNKVLGVGLVSRKVPRGASSRRGEQTKQDGKIQIEIEGETKEATRTRGWASVTYGMARGERGKDVDASFGLQKNYNGLPFHRKRGLFSDRSHRMFCSIVQH